VEARGTIESLGDAGCPRRSRATSGDGFERASVRLHGIFVARAERMHRYLRFVVAASAAACSATGNSPSPDTSDAGMPAFDAPPTKPPISLHESLLVMSGSDGRLFTVRGDGTDKTVLPRSGYSPSWTPDGKIIFVSTEVSPPQIVIASADGSNPHQVGNLTLDQNNPIAKPQLASGLIVFADVQGAPTQTEDNPGPQNGTWIMQQDGSTLRQLIQHCTAPSLAASARFITCTMEIDKHREIWRIDTNGTGLQQLTFPTDPDYPDGNASSISPDETTVALFSGKESDLGLNGFTQSILTWGHRDVGTIPAAGGPRRTITACTPVTTAAELQAFPAGACLASDNPAWSPDGKSLLYDRGSPNAGDSGTWMIDLDRQNLQRLYADTRGAGNVPMTYLVTR
jgi:hypothetical protein